MKIGHFRRDARAVEAGEWVDDLPGFPGVGFKVRGLNSTAFLEAQARRNRAIPAHQRGKDGSIPTALAYSIMGEAMAEALLMDWRGIEGDDGEPLAYDADLARVWLTDLDFVHFTEAVMEAAKRVDLGARILPVEDAAKN